MSEVCVFHTLAHILLTYSPLGCGCVPGSTHYPTAALSALAFGSREGFGPGCGACFKLTLSNAFLVTPQFWPEDPPSLVVKVSQLTEFEDTANVSSLLRTQVTDICPAVSEYCEATEGHPNKCVDGSASRRVMLSD